MIGLGFDIGRLEPHDSSREIFSERLSYYFNVTGGAYPRKLIFGTTLLKSTCMYTSPLEAIIGLIKRPRGSGTRLSHTEGAHSEWRHITSVSERPSPSPFRIPILPDACGQGFNVYDGLVPRLIPKKPTISFPDLTEVQATSTVRLK